MASAKVTAAKTLGILVTASRPDGTELPIKFNPVLNKANKATKLIAAFSPIAPGEGDGSARALKAHFKTANPSWKSSEVRDAVQKSLRNGASVREVMALALHTALIKGGALPDYSQMNLKGDSVAIHYTMAGRTPPDAAEKNLTKAESALAKQKAENEALAAKLAKLEALLNTLHPEICTPAASAAPVCMSDADLAARPIAPLPVCA